MIGEGVQNCTAEYYSVFYFCSVFFALLVVCFCSVMFHNCYPLISPVVMCLAIDMFAYWITTDVEKLQKASRVFEGSKVEVTFDVSFYLITAAGGMSVIATACNCLRRHSSYEMSESSRHAADHIYFDDVEALLPPSPTSEHSSQSNLPPPPAYSP